MQRIIRWDFSRMSRSFGIDVRRGVPSLFTTQRPFQSVPSPSDEGRSEGYDEFFEPPLESKYECPICLLGLREPVQTSCGHRFCKGCIKRSIRSVCVYFGRRVLYCEGGSEMCLLSTFYGVDSCPDIYIYIGSGWGNTKKSIDSIKSILMKHFTIPCMEFFWSVVLHLSACYVSKRWPFLKKNTFVEALRMWNWKEVT